MPRKRAAPDEKAINTYDYRQSSERGRLIAAGWQELLQSMTSRKSTEQSESAIKFLSALGREVGFIDTTPTPPPRVARDLLCERHVKFLQDIPKALGQTVRIHVTSGSQFSTQDYRYLTEVLSDAGLGYRVFVVIVPGHAPEAKVEARRDQPGLVVMDSEDVKEMTVHPQPQRVFYRIIRQQTKIELLQPYDHFGAVRSSMFFGRRTQLARIMLQPESSFAIFGGRRIGKSSLLTKLHSELSKDSLNRPIFFTAQGVKGTHDFSSRLLTNVLQAKLESKALVAASDLERTRNEIQRHVLISGKRVTVLIDEVDDLVIVDQPRGEPVMSMLRSLNEELHDKCRFVMAGFRRLYERRLSYYSPAMNFPIPMPLGGLDSESARRLIEVPLREYLGFDFSKPEVIQMALEYSSRSPWQIQHFCRILAQLLAEGRKDTIEEDDIRQVFDDFTFRSEIAETVLANLSPEQMMILCLFLDSGRFTREEVYEAFNQQKLPIDLAFLSRQLDQLVKFGVLSPPAKKNNNTFTFVYSYLPKIIREVETPSYLLAQAKSTIKQQHKRWR